MERSFRYALLCRSEHDVVKVIPAQMAIRPMLDGFETMVMQAVIDESRPLQ